MFNVLLDFLIAAISKANKIFLLAVFLIILPLPVHNVNKHGR